MIRKTVLSPMGIGFSLLMMVAGCAYDLNHVGHVIQPDRLAGVKIVSVSPFRYSYDWTGYFRDIYRQAELDPPKVKKVDRLEATFLVESALVRRGYDILTWPAAAKKMGWESGQSREGRERLVSVFRNSGADAILLLKGRNKCSRMFSCRAQVEMKLLDATGGDVLWEARGTGRTLIEFGNEMKAAIEEVISTLPDQ